MGMNVTNIRVRLTFTDELLGTANSDPDIHEAFIASKAPDAPSTAEEVEALGVEEVIEKGMTVFPRTADGDPFIWDYQIKGFFKDSCGMLRKASGSESGKIKAYKKEIDGLIFIEERQIPISLSGEIISCQRPLRAASPKGERVALANSEAVPAGSSIEFTIQIFDSHLENAVKEWLDYGKFRGIGQWRNSGKGRFEWEEIPFE